PVGGGVGGAGDGRADAVREAARAAGGSCDRLRGREGVARRGRAPGEVARLIVEGVACSAPDVPCEHVGDALTALRRLAPEVAAGTMVVLYYERFDEAHEALLGLGATPVESLAALRQGAGAPPHRAERPPAGG